MAASEISGPLFVAGNLSELRNSSGTILVADPNTDRGPSDVFMGIGQPDVRFFFPKDKVTGFTGVVASWYESPDFLTTYSVPAALASNNIAAAQNAVNGTAMTLAAASVGITLNVPISPIPGLGSVLNSGPIVTAGIALDFGFAFGNCAAGSATITVADSTQFTTGMPLVIGGVGNSAGTTCLLTQVATIVDATHITVNASAVPAATNATAPIGAGNLWGPSQNGYPIPTCALPYLACGPGLFLDPMQGIARGVQITGVSAGIGGTFLVSGWDIYGDSMSELITVGAGAVTGWGKKVFKYIQSIVPQFADAHNYSVGTSDVFGFHARSDIWELTAISWAGTFASASTGWTVADTTSPSTNITGDVRGTVQTSTNGGGSGLSGGAASNGTISGLAMTGRRLFLSENIPLRSIILATAGNPAALYGSVQN